MALLLLTKSLAVDAEDQCGSLANAYGPYDYSDPVERADKLPVVEQYHFDRDVEMLIGHREKGNNPGTVPGDLDYTLRAFPNHHRALYALVRYETETESPGKLRYSVDCYFVRAMRFAAHDAMVPMIYGLYLNRVGRVDDAIEFLTNSVSLNPGLAEAHYNLGLLYLSVGELESAKSHAKTAYDLQYPLTGLRDKLARAGAALVD
ncbi:MAG: hypothetical protein RIE06_27840 [Roseibium album]|uniref:hypothetical protein n=1 Tax=Roseibium album TaxID=311410 RepID=UPI0032EBC5A0